MVLDFLAVDNYNFTRKFVEKMGFIKIEFLDKNLTFRIVCNHLGKAFSKAKLRSTFTDNHQGGPGHFA